LKLPDTEEFLEDSKDMSLNGANNVGAVNNRVYVRVQNDL